MIPALPQVILSCLCRCTTNYPLSKLISLMLVWGRWQNNFWSPPLPNPTACILLIKMCCVLNIYNRIPSIAADSFHIPPQLQMCLNGKGCRLTGPVGLAVILLGLNQFMLDCCTGLTAWVCECKQIAAIIRLQLGNSIGQKFQAISISIAAPDSWRTHIAF